LVGHITTNRPSLRDSETFDLTPFFKEVISMGPGKFNNIILSCVTAIFLLLSDLKEMEPRGGDLFVEI
jgi:hypothetical protein